MAYSYALLELYNQIKKNIWSEFNGPKIDSTTLRINYKVTVSILLASSVVVTFHNWFGLGQIPIECYTADNKIIYLDDYCWLHPKNISVEEDAWTEKKINEHDEGFPMNDDSKYHSIYYYQWTAFFLLFQALCFYVPRFVWARWENETMANFKMSLNIKEWDDDKRAEVAAGLLVERSRKGYNQMYATGYLVSEILAVLNIIFQWWATTRFLGTVDTNWTGNIDFYNLGWKVMIGDGKGARHFIPLLLMFPRQVCCVFSMYGSGGFGKTQKARCILPLNIINDKIFIALWFWFFFVTIVTTLNFIYRLLVSTSKPLRKLKLDFEVLERKKDQQKEFILDAVCKEHSDFLIFENFRENFSKLIVRGTLMKIYEITAKDNIAMENKRMQQLKND